VIESRKTEHQLVATHHKEKMSKLIPGKPFKSRVMYHEGYIFHRNKIVAKTDTVYFKCSDKACGATGLKRGAGEFKLSKSHNEHEPVALEELKNLFVERLKERAESETTPLKDIYMEESQRAE
jgi:hypothetical protein